jgi:hypothetical protein
MRFIGCIIVALMLAAGTALAQFKSDLDKEPSASESLVKPATSFNSLLGLLNPENFRMRQNVSFSFLSSGGQGMSLASYTNSMFYKIADPLNVRFDLTLQGSPFGQAASPYQQALSGLFLSRAELNYRPWENVFIKLEYNHLPGFYSRWYDPWYNLPSSVSSGGDQ